MSVAVSLVLWSHALAALLFAVLALDRLRRTPGDGRAGRAFVVALVATACWALAMAGIDPRELAPRVAAAVRDLAWLGFMLALVRRDRSGGYALWSVYAVTAAMAAAAAALAVVATLPLDAAGIGAVERTRLACRMMGTIGALVLVQHLDDAAAGGETRPLAIALGALWGAELVTLATAFAFGWNEWLVAARGLAAAGAAGVLGLATRRRGRWDVTLSHSAAMRSLSLVAVMIYAGATAMATNLAGTLAGDHARLAQAATVFGATAALMTLLSTPWLRAWLRVKVAKHFFRHRYDYRAEWQRFTDALAGRGEAGPLDSRIVRAVAALTDSPAALLLVPAGGGLEPGAAWRWEAGEPCPAALTAHLATTGRIVELDEVRRGDAPATEMAAVPAWLTAHDEAWALVPLLHGDALIGAVLLARPPVDRALDWEDLDLLRIVGRQAASYIAEERAHAALADAARFDEFNRRFAFILHDIKNCVSGLTLVARNAERHADNPAFRADMVATLDDAATRMTALLARLSQRPQAAADEPFQPVDAGALAVRVAATRRAQHPIEVSGDGVVRAQPDRLEQVLGHLVRNAAEASAPGAPVAIAVAPDGDRVAIDVIDRGCGMSAAFVREQLFRPFASSKPGGFGLGAHEARQLVEAMGGRIEVTSREGAGSRFRILLPAATALEEAA